MTPLRSALVCGLAKAMLLVFPVMSWADGGTLIFSRACGGYRITLFTAPTTLRAGPVDFSVLVQAVDSGAPVLDVPVSIHAYPEIRPQQSTGGPATAAAATNKLFRAIQLELSEPGRWHVEVVIHSPEQAVRVEAELEVGPSLPSWIDLGIWIGWPVAAIFLFAVRQFFFVKREHGRAGTNKLLKSKHTE
jgi:hypothetical protein